MHTSNMATMDEYINQLLAEIPDTNSALHHVVQNILDEPIPDFVKGRLLKSLQPGNFRPSPAPRKQKAAKRKVILEEFDPLPHQKAIQTVQDYQQEIQEAFEEEQQKRHELVFYRTPWVIGSFLRGWQMDISEDHPSGVDVNALCKKWNPESMTSSKKRSWLSMASSSSLHSRSSFGRTTQTAVRSTQTLCCATSRRLFFRLAKSIRI